MNKVKLAICMDDLEYQARFVNCLMNHYQYLYEVHVFTRMEELELEPPSKYAVVISEECNTDALTKFVEAGNKILLLCEEEKAEEASTTADIRTTCKYQEVYRIAELIQRMTAIESTTFFSGVENTKKRTGIYSLSKEKYQVPVAALMAEIYAENEKVLILDLQSYSGLAEKETDSSHMGLEDLLSVATAGNFSKSRVLECVVSGEKWDYIYPVKNVECLAEGHVELYEKILDFMETELGYQRTIIIFGTAFSGQIDMMDHCNEFYLLCGREALGEWREAAYLDALERREKTQFLQKMKFIEVPEIASVSGSWDQLTEKWRWSTLGEGLRRLVREERENGEIVRGDKAESIRFA